MKRRRNIPLEKLSARKRAQVEFYRKNRKRLLAYANNYYAEHKEAVLEKAKARYAKNRKDYYCTVCGEKLPRTMSGHHLFCEKCAATHRVRRRSAKNKDTQKKATKKK